MSNGDLEHSYPWGNANYINLSLNETISYLGKKVTLVSMENNYCTVKVGSTEKKLVVARRSLPEVMEGIRVFVADNQNVKKLTSDDEFHGLLQKDAFICLSDAALPLLDPDRYSFPISRRDGYHWHMEERSQMFGYYGHAPYFKSAYHKSKGDKFYRSHEGIDFNLHDARGIEKHPLIAVETGTVGMVKQANDDEICIIIKSASDDNIYYIYKHVHVDHCYVKVGQSIQKGEMLAYIWGDGQWGHLHFSVVYRDELPDYDDRYFDLLNCFPQMYELWHGDLELHRKVWTEGQFTFGHKKWLVENKLKVAAYSDIIGYGWRIEDWCTAAAVDIHPDKSGNLPLRRIMHEGTAAECKNPNSFLDFEVAVQNGTYTVSAKVGDVAYPSWQQVSFNGVNAGTMELSADEYRWTDETTVKVDDGRLIVRMTFKDDNTIAGISEFHFKKEQN